MSRVKINSIAEGKAVVKNLNEAISAVVEAMRKPADNAHWERLSARKYDLVKERRAIQAQMAKLFREARKVRHEG